MLPKFPAFVAENVAWNTRICAFVHAHRKLPPILSAWLVSALRHCRYIE